MPSNPDSTTVSSVPSRASASSKTTQSRGFGSVVNLGIDSVWMPAPGEQLLRFHAFDDDLEWNVLISRMAFFWLALGVYAIMWIVFRLVRILSRSLA